MYNTFEFYPIVLRADKNIEKSTFHQPPKLDTSFNVMTKPDSNHDLENSLPSLKSTQFHDALVEKVDILDPIMKHVMADPVKCHDGFTYDRCSIEHYFAVRKEEQEKRMKVLQHGENTETSNEEAGTCSGKLLPIELLSPMTQQALPSEVLIPDLNMESLIVRAMERKVFRLSQDDIADWNTRRAEKKKSDEQRESQRQISHGQGILAPEEGNHTLAHSWMRMDRDIRYSDRKLGGNDLGFLFLFAWRKTESLKNMLSLVITKYDAWWHVVPCPSTKLVGVRVVEDYVAPNA
jgi:U-box domain